MKAKPFNKSFKKSLLQLTCDRLRIIIGMPFFMIGVVICWLSALVMIGPEGANMIWKKF
jgi:hypothetical protein